MAVKKATPADEAQKPAPAKKAKSGPAKAASVAAKAAPKTKADPAKTAKADAKTSTKGPNSALQKPLTPSKDLAHIVGSEPLPRTAVVSKMWDYIRKHDLQNPKDKREILADAKLKVIFGKDKATMFELNKLISSHLV